MYDKRIKIFIGISSLLLFVCLLRLVQMQLLPGSTVQDDIAKLRAQGQESRQLKTIRGKILDRNGRILATDEPRFHLCISYDLCSVFDSRIRKAILLRAGKIQFRAGAVSPLEKARKKTEAKVSDLEQIINKSDLFGVPREDLEDKIRKINDEIWNFRSFLAWWRAYPNYDLRDYYGSVESIPTQVAIEDFEKRDPDEDSRILSTTKVDIPRLHEDYPLFALKTDDDVFKAQLEFMKIEGISIQAKGQRVYPFATAACQTIGWVGTASQETDKLDYDPNDKLSTYLTGEVCGREDGVEFVCESILRGKRGEKVYDIDLELIRETQTKFGQDVQLTLDIELQMRIENYLANFDHAAGCGPGMATVVIDVKTNEILALVSMPLYDLNRIRVDYSKLSSDPNRPTINRTINNWYPPGSVIKPITLIVGLETGKITANEVFSCPAQAAPRYWPNCWRFNDYGLGHDGQWENNARNAIKGSCNIYFSHLGDRIGSRVFQKWLFNFGYGRPLLSCPASIAHTEFAREFRQLPGMISSTKSKGPVTKFEDIPPLENSEKRWFGMGQGKLLVTPMQVANAMATIARDCIFKFPHLFIGDQNDVESKGTNLGVSSATMNTVLDGMSAVVNESQGTAHSMFISMLPKFANEGIKVFGKTGSTQPAHAWFAGFAKDDNGKSITVAVLVEGGQHGSSDAAPLARDIIQFCVEAGYIGKPVVEAGKTTTGQ